MARYTGRHLRQTRHGSWENEKRSHTKSTRQLLPVFATLAVAGLLIGGGGLVIRFGGPGQGSAVDNASSYDAADYPPADRDAQGSRISRDELRLGAVAPAAGAPETTNVAGPKTTTPTQPTKVAKTQPSVVKTTKAKTAASGNADVMSSGTCQASFYDEGQQTANGETFDPDALTAANKTLPFNTMVRVTNVANGKSVVVRINDRGPYVSGRCLDLSSAAFATIASLGAGVANVRYDVLG